jgi:hypothetical protein
MNPRILWIRLKGIRLRGKISPVVDGKSRENGLRMQRGDRAGLSEMRSKVDEML